MNVKMEDFLEHYGVKGMHWGVRKDRPTKFSEHSDELKFGVAASKNSTKVPVEQRHGFNRLTSKQKKEALLIGGFALVGAAMYLNRGKFSSKTGIETAEEMGRYCLGFEKHWDAGVHLPNGSILKRMSTVKETTIRTDGFYSSFKPEDIAHYHNLPKLRNNPTYYEISYRALKDVRAPSGKESFDIYKNLFDDETLKRVGREDILTLSKRAKKAAIAEHAKMTFWPFTQNWLPGYDQDPDVSRFFTEVRSRGYNSLIDFFDAGAGAQTPLRVLDGNSFEILSHTTFSGMANVSHASDLNEQTEKGGFMPQDITDFLEHYGVKGMRWGVRTKAKNVSTRVRAKSTKRTMNSLSNQELQAAITRMNLERQYTQLKSSPALAVKRKGAKVTEDILTNVGKTALSVVATAYVAKKMSNRFPTLFKDPFIDKVVN